MNKNWCEFVLYYLIQILVWVEPDIVSK